MSQEHTEVSAFEVGLSSLFADSLRRPESIRVLVPAEGREPIRAGLHSHDGWELFAPLRGKMYFSAAHRNPFEVDKGSLLLVPPSCLHELVSCHRQPPDLQLLVMNLPGETEPYSTVWVGPPGGSSPRMAFSADDLRDWANLLGESPALVMQRAASALRKENRWSREQGRAILAWLLSTFGEIAFATCSSRPRARSARRAGAALSVLQTRYYEPDLSVAKVARAAGLSASHLNSVFRATYGRSVHQTLREIRLRRASELLRGGKHSVKEIAGLTGWSHQLYFSTAFRRRYGRPPSKW